MLRKLSIISALIALLFVPGVVLAQQESSPGLDVEETTIAPDFLPPQPRDPAFLGQDHGYTVVFRGNGEAIVTAKITFSNKEEENLDQLKFRIPKIEPKNLTVYQVVREGRCMRYGPRKYDIETKEYLEADCLEYQSPDYYQTYYSNAKYQKAKYDLDIDTLTVTLPKPVKPNSSGSFFIYFRAFGYAKKDIFGAYNYTFETLKSEDEVNSLRAGISTDSDLVLKGAKGEVQYRFEEPVFTDSGMAAMEGAPAKSTSMDRYYNQIGGGRITKSASNLAPLESYTVKGSYASSKLKLYAKEALIALGVFIVFLIVLVLAIKLVLKRLGGIKAQAEAAGKQMKPVEAERIKMLLTSAGVSFISSLLIVGYTIFLALAARYAFGLMYNYQALIMLFVVIISFFIYALLFFGPGVYVGIKKGFAWGIATLILTIMWLGFYLIVGVVVVNLFFNRSYPNPIMF